MKTILVIFISLFCFLPDLSSQEVIVLSQDSISQIVPGTSPATIKEAEVVKIAPEELNVGNTAWMLVATILVMLMTIPGLAFFYGGLVRRKNVLSIMMQCLALTAIISIIWVAFGYSWVFGKSFMDTDNPLRFFIGGFDKIFLKGVSIHSLIEGVNIPEILFAMFQCKFAIITPALMIGAFAERIKFSGFLLFSVLWAIIVYNPMAHWVWGGGWMQQMGAIDFAGGTVVHVNAGVSALVMAIMLGRRKGYRTVGHPIPPHNIPFVVLGTALLWLGWFGFNAGSGLAANGLAANALFVTHLATAVAAFVWMALEWIINKKPTIVGICTGSVAGLVAITPAAGTVDVIGAFFIGIASSLVCFFMVAWVKPKLKYDDALDAFGVHGVGGFVGAILTGVFATQLVSGEGRVQGALFGDYNQLWIQFVCNAAAVVYSAVLTLVLFKIVDKLVGLRVSKENESMGLDIMEHGELAYSDDE
ncbi:ammonium transporter [Dysgonomonas sp. Marseille-P4361]|uniref:ammonium transporter n=1 Tax=Dysgonomonas sp. Marseille-P4361 TaxID=2161820 RepID=UPI000D5578A0